MKRYVLLGIMSLAAAQPAVAQYRQPSAQPYSGNRAESPRQLIDQLQRRVDYDFQRGIIRREDARWLRAELNRLRRQEYQYGNYGFGTRERASLVRQIDRLRSDLSTAERRRYARNVPLRSPYAEPFEEQTQPRHDVDNHVNRDLGRYDRTFDDRANAEARPGDYDRNGSVNENDLRGPPPPLHDEGD